MMSFSDARSIGWSNNIIGDLFINGQLQERYTFYKEKLIGRKNFDHATYAIIDSKEMIDKNKNSKIEIEFHLKSTEKFTIFEKTHKYPGLMELNPSDLMIHYIHFGRMINAICIACYDLSVSIL